jgi:hypothetical protein
VFPNHPMMSPLGRNIGFHYQFPPMDTSQMNNPYFLPFNNFQFPPMQMYPYPIPNPNMNYFNNPHLVNNHTYPVKVTNTSNEASQGGNTKDIKK